MTDFISISDSDKRADIAEDILFYATELNMLTLNKSLGYLLSQN